MEKISAREVEKIDLPDKIEDLPYENKVLDLAVLAGTELMKGGAEAFRVENTVYRMLNILEDCQANVVALMTGLYVSVRTKEGEYITTNQRIQDRNWNLDKIITVNNISRKFTSGKIDVEEAKKELIELQHHKKSRVISDLAQIFTSSFFVMMLSGTFTDFLISIFAGVVLVIFQHLTGSGKYMSGFVSTFVYAFVLSAAISLISQNIDAQSNINIIITGTLVILYPGIMLSNGIRDLMQGDTLTGIGNLIQAVITAASLAFGSALALILLGGGFI